MKILRYIVIIALSGSLGGCAKEEEIVNTATQVGHSRITFFPVLTLKGDKHVAVPVGGTYTEPGSTALEGTTTITPTVSGTVNTATPGVYTLTYTATNKDGFLVTDTRTVAVYATDATAAANDLSGSYLREVTGVSASWVKLAPGVYVITNPGGAATGGSLKVIAFNPTGFTVSIPSQTSSDGNTSSSTNFTYTNGNPATYTLVFNNPGYGNGVRTFKKI
jgi:hypothetical protein